MKKLRHQKVFALTLPVDGLTIIFRYTTSYTPSEMSINNKHTSEPPDDKKKVKKKIC